MRLNLFFILGATLGFALAGHAQYGPISLLVGGTNNVPTNYVLNLSTSAGRISLGHYKNLALHFEQRTVAATNTNHVVWAWKWSVDGTTTISNLWALMTIPLDGPLTNTVFTNLALPTASAIQLVWISNMNANAFSTNCLTNLTLKYLLKE